MTDVSDLARRLGRLAKKNKAIELGRKLSVKDVQAFEKKQRIVLPDEYRAFLLAVGEGASGPDYGLLPLAAAIEERGKTIYDLADPFPAPQSCVDYLDFAVGGILPVCYSGCAYFTGIVTSGPNRGEMWFSVEERPGWVPHWSGSLVDAKGRPFQQKGDDYGAVYDAALGVKNAKRRLGFAGWYSAWLEGEEKALGIGAS